VAAVPVVIISDGATSDMDGDELLRRLNAIGWNLEEAQRRGARDRLHLHRMLHGLDFVPASFALYVSRVEAAIRDQPGRPAGWGGAGRHVAGGTAQAPPVI
jgi:hypothetical protein